jgi:SAM-dependent methyltransferase
MRQALAIGCLSAAAIAYEVCLVRAFSIAEWSHFAPMVIGIALLGYGASGTLLTIGRERLGPSRLPPFGLLAGLFAIGSLLAFPLSRQVPVDLLELPWDPRQLGGLFLAYLVLALPFVFAGAALGVALIGARLRVGRVYRSDLIGAGAGALAALAALSILPTATGLRAVAMTAILAAALAPTRSNSQRWTTGLVVLVGITGIVVLPTQFLQPKPTQYKALSIAQRLPGARIVAERYGPLGELSVVESPQAPLRYAPGLSLLARQSPPDQLAVFIDGDSLTPITRFDGSLEPLAYLDDLATALPFRLRSQPSVLVLGSGGGADVLLALRGGAASIVAVELNPQLAELVSTTFAGFAGHLFQRPEVRLHVADARIFIAATGQSFDLIFLPLVAGGSIGGGMQSVGESMLFTREAFASYLDRLAPAGILVATHWLRVPPRDALRAFATAVDVLRQRGIADPAQHLALIRSWATSTLLVSIQPFTPADLDVIRTFCVERAFDIAYMPGIAREETNRFNRLDGFEHYDGAVALLGAAAEDFLDRYKFDVRPVTDDRPYFFRFLKTATLIELIGEHARRGTNLVEWGYPLLLATFAQAIVGSVLLILLPLAFLRRSTERRVRIGEAAPVAGYFTALGFAFLFIEIGFIQRFQLFLGHPVVAVATLLSGFLVFAGLGAGHADSRVADGARSARRTLLVAVGMIVFITSIYALLLTPLLQAMAGLPMALRVAVSVVLVAPLAFAMGMPFPLGLASTAASRPSLVPWAWAVNGCASVIATSLAALIAVHGGFSSLFACAAALYLVAGLLFGGLTSQPGAVPPAPR